MEFAGVATILDFSDCNVSVKSFVGFSSVESTSSSSLTVEVLYILRCFRDIIPYSCEMQLFYSSTGLIDLSFSRARFQYRKHPGPRPLRNRTWPKGFPWLSRHNKQIVEEANNFIERCLAACGFSAAAGGEFLLEHPEDLGLVEGEHPGSIWQWEELQELLVQSAAVTFAIHQCQFGALYPKPTRLLTNAHVDDPSCHFGLPKFDKNSKYIGPLSQSCGHHHQHKLIGKTQEKWNTAPSAAYPEKLCRFIVQMILDSCSHSPDGRGVKNLKRKAGGQDTPTASPPVIDLCDDETQLEATMAPVDKKTRLASTSDVNHTCSVDLLQEHHWLNVTQKNSSILRLA